MWIDDFRSIMKDTGEDKFYDTHYFGRVDSTNEVIKRAFRTGRLTLSPDEGDIVQGEHDSDRNSAPASPKEGFLVIGEEQTAGKGRIGRKWVSPAGESVYFSFLLQPKVDSEHVSALTLVMGLSVAQAVRSVLAQTARIKWPNDIVIHGKKICGILTEAQAGPEGLDYVVINDCSKDDTAQLLTAHGMHFIDLPVNLGIGGAVQTGYRYALAHGYDAAVQVDGDGQHDPAFLSVMAKTLEEEGADMVIGSRFIRHEGFQSSFARRVGILYFTRLIRLLTGKTITDPTSGLRMIGRKGIAMFAKEYPRDYPEPESVVELLRSGGKVLEIPVVMRERQGGTSSIRFRNSVYYMIKVTLAILIACIRKKGE